MPRLINQLCDTALVYGYADQRERIDLELMAQVVEDRMAGGLFPTAEVAAASRTMSCRVAVTLVALLTSSGFAAANGQPAAAPPTVILPQTSFTANELAVVINDADPLSAAVGEYYRAQARDSAGQHRAREVSTPRAAALTPREFAALRAEVRAATPSHVQAYALTWVRPYRVDCMSMTTALAAGFDRAFCSERCTATRWSPYYNSNEPQALSADSVCGRR